MRAQMGNVLAEGNKKCLEIKGKIPKSSKHLLWGEGAGEPLICYPFHDDKIHF